MSHYADQYDALYARSGAIKVDPIARLTTATQQDGKDLPNEACVFVLVGDIRAALSPAAPDKITIARDLAEAMVSVIRALEAKDTGRVDDWKLSDIRDELSFCLA